MLNTCITLYLHVHIDGMFILIFLRMGIWLVIALFSIRSAVDQPFWFSFSAFNHRSKFRCFHTVPPTYIEAISTGESYRIAYEDQCSSGQLRGQTLKQSLSCSFHDPGQFSPPYLQDGSVNQFYHHSHTSPNPVLNQFHLPPDGVSVHNYSLSDVTLSDNCQNLPEDVASKSMPGDLGEYQFDGKEKDKREKARVHIFCLLERNRLRYILTCKEIIIVTQMGFIVH